MKGHAEAVEHPHYNTPAPDEKLYTVLVTVKSGLNQRVFIHARREAEAIRKTLRRARFQDDRCVPLAVTVREAVPTANGGYR